MKTFRSLLDLVRDVVEVFMPSWRYCNEFGPVMFQVVNGKRLTRFCPHCGAGSTIPESRWRRIEAHDEAITCMACFRVPRLWMREAVQ